MDAEKLATILGELAGRRDLLASVKMRGSERPWALADKESWITSARRATAWSGWKRCASTA
jgi:hypothetical protein